MEQDFYYLSFKSNNIDLFVEVVGKYDEYKLKTGEFTPEYLLVKKSQGKKAYDIVRLQDVFNFLISDRLRNELEEANLTGWKTYKIKSDDFDESYVGFQCTGKCGVPDRPIKSGIITGYSFDINTWDGSDFFIPETTLQVLCTGRAMNVLKRLKMKNIELKDIKTLEWYNV